jgi:hypothetical protein
MQDVPVFLDIHGKIKIGECEIPVSQYVDRAEKNGIQRGEQQRPEQRLII